MGKHKILLNHADKTQAPIRHLKKCLFMFLNCKYNVRGRNDKLPHDCYQLKNKYFGTSELFFQNVHKFEFFIP